MKNLFSGLITDEEYDVIKRLSELNDVSFEILLIGLCIPRMQCILQFIKKNIEEALANEK